MSIPPLNSPADRRGDLPSRFFSLPAHLALAGESELMRRTRMQIQVIAPYMRTAFVLSDAGLGEDAIAAELHRSGPGRAGRLVAISATELKAMEANESGAVLPQLLRDAAGGSLFLREIGEFSPSMQAMLLEFLRAHGKDQEAAQIIVSSRQTLKGQAAAGTFSSELLYRLTSVVIQIPSLLERSEDLPTLVTLGVDAIAQSYDRPAPAIESDAMQRLVEHAWPGNLLELENVLRQIVLESEHELITGAQVGRILEDRAPVDKDLERLVSAGSLTRLQDVIDLHVLTVMERCSGNKLRAAEMLGVSRSTLYRMLDAATGSGSDIKTA